MRTYSRNPTEHKELENALDLCRLCLEKPDECIPIYTDDSNLYSSLAVRIMICVGLEMVKEDCVSNIICVRCHKELEQYYLFRKKCTQSYQKLKSHIQAVKIKDKGRRAGAGQNLTFTIGIDGSILLQEGNIGSSSSESMSCKSSSEPKKTTAAIDVSNKQDEVVVLEPHHEECLPDPTPSRSKKIFLPEETFPPEKSPEPEISEFLCTMLTELGILTKYGDGIVDLTPETSRSLELETREGNNVVLELVEEDEELEINSEDGLKGKDTIFVKDEQSSSPKFPDKAGALLAHGKCKCPECGRVLASRSVLARHQRAVHAGLRPHACPICGKKFAQKEVMARHKLVHQEKRPFQCTKCPKSFTQRASLETHGQFHLPWQERALTLHQCARCPKTFLHESGLARHALQHSDKRFPCALCGRPFADKSSLRRHEKNAHCNKHSHTATAATEAVES